MYNYVSGSLPRTDRPNTDKKEAKSTDCFVMYCSLDSCYRVRQSKDVLSNVIMMFVAPPLELTIQISDKQGSDLINYNEC